MVLDWGLNPGPPVIEASTLPLGFRGGGKVYRTEHLSFALSYTDYHNVTGSNIPIVGIV